MTTRKKHPKHSYPVFFTLVFILALGLVPQLLHAETLRIVYSNDNLGELAPCG